MKLLDRFERRIDYLRISVTDRCNLRCKYCIPECGISNKFHDELLSFEEIAKIVKMGVTLGIDKVRLTGGEPLVRKDIVDLVKILSEIEGLNDISMTTNGTLLKDKALELKKAGLKRLNISLDSLKEDKYRDITRGGELKDVKEAIELCLDAGFDPLKINVLLLAGINEDEIVDFLRLTKNLPLHVRFLEFMPTKGNEFWGTGENFVSYKDIMTISYGLGHVELVSTHGNGPAENFRIKNALGTFGFIAPMSKSFCSSCNRLRLTSDGFLKGCLHSELKINLKDSIRRGMDEKDLLGLIKLVAATKPEKHNINENPISSSEYLMCQIGG